MKGGQEGDLSEIAGGIFHWSPCSKDTRRLVLEAGNRVIFLTSKPPPQQGRVMRNFARDGQASLSVER